LGEQTDEQLKKAGITFVWGFPNQNSEYGYTQKLNWQHQHRMLAFTFKVSALPLASLSQKVTAFSEMYRERSNKILMEFQSAAASMKSSVEGDGFCGTSRDAAFFQYKNFSDNFILELGGKKVWLKINNGLWIGDLEMMSDAELDVVLEELKTLAARLGCKEVSFQFSPGTYFGDLLSNKTKPFETWVAGYKNYNSSFPLEKLRFSWGDLDTF